jgi:hypothetical protein
MKTIPLTQGKFAIVDDDDYIRVIESSWCISTTGYPKATIKQSQVLLHRFIMNPPSNVAIDHKNNNKLDNRKCNLRFCTQKQNVHNQGKTRGVSKYKGVTWDKSRSKWKSQIACDYEHYNIGRFDKEIDAAKAYDIKAKEMFGEFAYLNFRESNNS